MTTRDLHSWTDVREDLLRRIQARDWHPGELIPGEAELAAEIGCARTTVSRALRDLAESGLVIRKRKAGTRVALNPPHKATLTVPIVREEVEALGAAYRHAVLESEVRKLPPHLGGAFHLPEGTDVLFQRTLHFADDRPFVHEERHTSLAAVPQMPKADFTAISANEWLVQNAPFTGVDMVFFAETAGATVGAAFAIPPEAALFVAERTTWNGQAPITHVRMAYAPGYRMRAR